MSRERGLLGVVDDRSARTRTLGVVILVVAWTAIVAVSVGHLVALVQNAADGDSTRIGLDYRAFVAAGELIRSGNAEFLYEPASAVFARLAEVEFLYPPWAAFFLVPWSLLAFEVGFVLWTLFGVVGMVLAMRWAGVRNGGFLLATLLVFPSVFALGLGQSAHLLVAMTALAFGLIERGRWSTSGIVIALAAWKPHLLGGWGIAAIAGIPTWNRWIRAAAVTTGALLVVSSLAIPGSWVSWWELLTGDPDGFASPSLEVSLPGMVSLLFGTTGSSRIVEVVLMATAVTVGVLVLRRHDAGLAPQIGFATALWLLFVPHLVVYGVLLLALPLGVMLDSRYRKDVIVAGTAIAFCVSIGPVVVETQLDAFGRALDLSTVGLLIAVAVFAAWITRGRPLLDEVTDPGSRIAHQHDVLDG